MKREPQPRENQIAAQPPEGRAQTKSRDQMQRIPDELCDAVYEELRRVAAWHLSSLIENVTLSPTDLTHEAVARVLQQRRTEWESESHLIAITALMSRRVLMNHLRSKNTSKRDPRARRICLDTVQVANGSATQLDLIAIDDALTKLQKIDQRQAVIVELKFFGGLPSASIAEFLGLSPRTIQIAWTHARLWLTRELCDE